jgi:hypothetical protein
MLGDLLGLWARRITGRLPPAPAGLIAPIPDSDG